MQIAAAVLVGLVAVVHAYILVLEMFLWNTPRGHKAFALEPDFAAKSAVLAANQGLYNGFLSAGLFWGLFAYGVVAGRPILTFFLVCVAVAGLYGAATAAKKILFVQTIPALIALALVWLA
jgi:putative membrane protein